MTKKDDLIRLIQKQIATEQKYPFDKKTYLRVLSKPYQIRQLSEFNCSPDTCIEDSKIINQHLARLVEGKRNQEITVEKDFAEEFVHSYKKQNQNSKDMVKSVLEGKGEAVTILWTFMPYIYSKLTNNYGLNRNKAMELIFKWVKLTYYFNQVKFSEKTKILEVVPFSRIQMGYYLSPNTGDISHKFTNQEADFLVEKIIDQLG